MVFPIPGIAALPARAGFGPTRTAGPMAHLFRNRTRRRHDLGRPHKTRLRIQQKADLRRYRKLVEAVKKVYPVAQAAKAQMVQMEAELLRLETKKEQKQYIKGIAAAIKKEYTPVLKHMTRTQGRVLLKLIDRKRNTRLTKSSGSSGRLRRGILAKRIAYLRTESQVGIRPRRGRQGTRTDRSLLRSGAAVNRIRPPFTDNRPCFPSVCNLRSHRRHDRMPSTLPFDRRKYPYGHDLRTTPSKYKYICICISVRHFHNLWLRLKRFDPTKCR